MLPVAALLASAAATVAQGFRHEPQQHLLIDDAVVASAAGTRTVLGPVAKSPANPLLAEDREWEASWKNTNPSIEYVDGVYHLWMTSNVVRGAPRHCAKCICNRTDTFGG